jgi:hypothetical protein
LFKYRLVKPGTFKTEVGLDWFIATIISFNAVNN